MTTIFFLCFLFVFLEFFESSWQKANTFYGVIKKNYQIYNKNIFVYFLFNPAFFFSLFIALYFNNFSFLMCSIIVLKFLDISFRLFLMNKIQKDEDITYLVPLDIEYTGLLRYFNVILYPMTFLFSFL